MLKLRGKWICSGRIRLKEWRRNSWTKYKVEESKKEAFRGRGAPLEWRKGGYAKTRDTEQGSGEKIAGQEFFPCLESTTCCVGKASRMSQRKKRDEAAAKNGDHERLHKENQIKRKNRR